MLSILRVLLKNDPTGTLTVTVIGKGNNDRTLVGHVGGTPVNAVSQVVSSIVANLDSTQDHWSGVFETPAKKAK